MVVRILDLVKGRGISERFLIKELGLSIGIFTNWKNGKAKPSADAIIKIAQYFNVSTDYLLLGETNDKPHMRSITNEKEFMLMGNYPEKNYAQEAIKHLKDLLRDNYDMGRLYNLLGGADIDLSQITFFNFLNGEGDVHLHCEEIVKVYNLVDKYYCQTNSAAKLALNKYLESAILCGYYKQHEDDVQAALDKNKKGAAGE